MVRPARTLGRHRAGPVPRRGAREGGQPDTTSPNSPAGPGPTGHPFLAHPRRHPQPLVASLDGQGPALRAPGPDRSVRFDIDMVEAADLAEGAPAHTAWRVLCDQPGVGWVTAGKLLTRKRPRLLPVYDQVVRCVLGRPKSFWLDLHGALRADNHALHRELMALRQSAYLPATVSALRVCDVVLWIHHCTDHQQRSCIGT
ncbi:DUF6308 family protein [Streptomyces bottropensis]|uniref:DUF6308 family protein n=1 Tax=Streptomyces bottropensis TaxID=42235 RepID=UPI00369A10C4